MVPFDTNKVFNFEEVHFICFFFVVVVVCDFGVTSKKVTVKFAQLCPTLCDPMEFSKPEY